MNGGPSPLSCGLCPDPSGWGDGKGDSNRHDKKGRDRVKFASVKGVFSPMTFIFDDRRLKGVTWGS
jgi:hypothetical protein